MEVQEEKREMTRYIIISTALDMTTEEDVKLLEWVDMKRETPWGTITRSRFLRNLIFIAKEKEK